MRYEWKFWKVYPKTISDSSDDPNSTETQDPSDTEENECIEDIALTLPEHCLVGDSKKILPENLATSGIHGSSKEWKNKS